MLYVFKELYVRNCMIDYHIHSSYSLDGQSLPHEYSTAARQYGLKEIGFAEHVDLDPDLYGYQGLDFSLYSKALKNLQEYAPIPVRCGLEVSYQHRLEDSIKEYLSEKDCDFIIGSVHEVHGVTMDHTFLQRHSPQEYFQAVEALITSGICDIVGHFEYFKRWGGSYSPPDFEDDISIILQQIIERNLVLEINTSGLRHHAKDTYPSLKVVKLYRSLGGELISLGSDAHNVKHIAFQFPKVVTWLKSEGFNVLATFERRNLDFIEL
jgi:histidinol-phosphatase (PHP family)